MRNSRTVEIAVGALAALGVAAFVMLALQVSDVSGFGDDSGYTLTARFDNIGGLKVRSPVTVAGVRVGRVVGVDVDRETFEAVVKLRILSAFDQIPEDTSASILTSGLLGEQYVGLEAGGALDVLADGDEIILTQSALVLEQIVGQVLFQKATEPSGE